MERMERLEGEYVTSSVVPGRKVLVGEGAAAVMIVPPRLQPASPGCAPQIELVRDGEVIQAIDVTCSCGQKIRLRCLYEGPVAGG
ncbi:MAG TPA: hypothetical protein VKA46_36045 [Gemmataceae bacterium]|nr:hypothetical protein [Gemmataceae bacterium]